MGRGLTLDTGALFALERRDPRMANAFAAATRNRRRVTVPTVVLAEWWRGQRGRIAALLRVVEQEPLTPRLARVAGEAIASIRGATAIDAIVMASAAQRGDIVYTSDFDDLSRLRAAFPEVTVLRS